MKNAKVRLAGGAILAASFVVLAGCSTSASESDATLKPLRINQAVETLGYLPLYVAEEEGYFADHGLDLKLTTAGTGSGAWSSVLGGSDDFSLHDPVFVPISNASGGDGVVVASMYDAAGIWVIGKSDDELQQNPTGFDGSSVVTMPEPDSTWAFFNYLVENKGLDRASIDQMVVNPGNELAPVLSGRADYALANEPLVSQGVAQGLNVNYSFADDPEWYPFAFSSIVSTRKFVEANPDVVEGMKAALNEAFTLIQDNPERAVEIAQSKFDDLEPEVVEAAVARATSAKGYPSDSSVSREAWDNAMRMAAFVGNVAEHPSDVTSYENNVLDAEDN